VRFRSGSETESGTGKGGAGGDGEGGRSAGGSAVGAGAEFVGRSGRLEDSCEGIGMVWERNVAVADVGNHLYVGKKRMFKGHKWGRVERLALLEEVLVSTRETESTGTHTKGLSRTISSITAT